MPRLVCSMMQRNAGRRDLAARTARYRVGERTTLRPTRRNATRSTVSRWAELHCTALPHAAWHDAALHCVSLHHTAVRCIWLYCITRCRPVLLCTTLCWRVWKQAAHLDMMRSHFMKQYVYIYIYTCMCVYIYIYIYVCMDVCMYV